MRRLDIGDVFLPVAGLIDSVSSPSSTQHNFRTTFPLHQPLVSSWAAAQRGVETGSTTSSHHMVQALRQQELSAITRDRVLCFSRHEPTASEL